MQIRGEGEGLLGEDEAESSVNAQRVMYVLHPNCSVEEV